MTKIQQKIFVIKSRQKLDSARLSTGSLQSDFVNYEYGSKIDEIV